MKKLFLAIALILFSAHSYAVIKKTLPEKAEEVVSNFTQKKETKKVCPVYSDSPMSEIERSPWELELGFNMMYSPTNGKPQFTLESWSAEVVHNLSSALGAYVRYDDLKFEKKDYNGLEYAGKWSGKAAAAGFQFYFFPTFRIYAGVGTAEMEAENGGKSDYGSFVDWGAKIDIPLENWGYKAVIAYKVVGVDSKDDEGEADVLQDWSYNAISFTLSFPFGYGTKE